MSEIFRARNGIELDEFGRLEWVRSETNKAVHVSVHEARKEFYQHLRDKELGRWRSKEHPDYVVYVRSDDDHVLVVNEKTGKNCLARHRSSIDIDTLPIKVREVAHEWLEAHKPARPWLSARAGEVWQITVKGGWVYTALAVQARPETVPYFITLDAVFKYPNEIIDAKLIWAGENND